MSVQQAFPHPSPRSAYEASQRRIERALATYGCLDEAHLLELLCHGGAESCTHAALQSAVRTGAVRRVGDVYALPHHA